MKSSHSPFKNWLGGIFAAVLSLACLYTPAKAQLVTNGNFETGDFTGWTLAGNTSGSIVVQSGVAGYTAENGNYYAALGAVGSLAYLSQNVATTPGQSYNLTYYLSSHGTTPNEFSTSIGGTLVYDLTNIPTQPWIEYSFKFTATSSSTLVSFGSRDDPNFLALDNVSVQVAPDLILATPEPSTWALLLGGLGLLALFRLHSRRA